MIFEELNQLFFTIRKNINYYFSENFNDGVMINNEKIDLILFTMIILILIICFFGCFLLFRLNRKNKYDSDLNLNKEKKENKYIDQNLNDKEILPKEKNEEEYVKIKKIEKEKNKKFELINNDIPEQNRNKKEEEKSFEVEKVNEDPESFFERLKKGIGKTRNQLLTNLSNVVLGKKQIDEDLLDDLEEVLIGSDIGPETTLHIIKSITEKVERKELTDPQILQTEIKQEILKILGKKYPNHNAIYNSPLILLIVGVNGVGKTTTIGKIASQYRQQGKKVLMGACDTFRAAAIEQLEEWSTRADCDIFRKDPGSDPSSVIYETVQKGIKENFDVVICDTAGRLHTKKNLMEELKKMVRVIQKLIPDAPHEVFLVLDATTGQNAVLQTREFKEAAELTGLIITKLDGTSKGGVIIGIVNEFDIPVRYIGIGEQVEDLRPFNSRQFADSIFF